MGRWESPDEVIPAAAWVTPSFLSFWVDMSKWLTPKRNVLLVWFATVITRVFRAKAWAVVALIG